MYATYLRLDLGMHDDWRAVIRAAVRVLRRQARRDPAQRHARKCFYREMLEHHASAQALVRHWRL